MTTSVIDLQHLAVGAYVYAFPLVFNLDQVNRFATKGTGDQSVCDFNNLNHIRALAGPNDTFVSVNNDTVYSFAQLDLSGGPVLLELPDSAGRYYVMQFISAWTENFAYIGKRATGTHRQRYLVVGPDWKDQSPGRLDDTTLIQSPTAVCSLVGRWAVDGEADLAAVRSLQDATVLTPLPVDAARDGLPPVHTDGLDEALAFWEKYRVYSQAFAPPKRDWPTQAAFAPLGLTAQTPVAELSFEIRQALVDGYRAAVDTVDRRLRDSRLDTTNGWGDTVGIFDYNLDNFQVGTKSEPRWKIEDPERRLLSRAGAAREGLWGCHAYEAAYFTAYLDADGQLLTGAHEYELTLDPPPANDAFWSLTMYDDHDHFLVANATNRYSVGDRTAGLVTADNGAVTITISHSEPTDARARANWLPAPDSGFRPMLRVYLPDEAVARGDYALPPIHRVR